MSIKAETKSISYLKEHTEELIAQINETRKPIFLTQNNKTKAVILDIDSYEKLLEISNMLQMISFKADDVKEEKKSGDFIEQSAFYKEFKERISE